MMDKIQDKEVLLGRTERAEWPVLGALFGGFFLALFLFWCFMGIAKQHYFTTNIHWGFERQIPFVGEAVVLYLSMIPMLLLTPLLFRTWRLMLPFLIALLVQALGVGCTSLFVAGHNAFPQLPDMDLYSWLLRRTDTYVPLFSLHTAFTVTVTMVYMRAARMAYRILLILWGIVTSCSALLLHEHHLMSLFTGAGLALLVMSTVYPWCSRKAFLQLVHAEATSFYDMYLFSQRHRRYFLTSVMIIVVSLVSWRRMRPIRFGFAFLQGIDDVIDGDRPCQEDAVLMTRRLCEKLHKNQLDEHPWSLRASAFIQAIPQPEQQQVVKQQIIQLLQTLLHDRERMQAASIWSATQLREHHRATFQPSIDLLMLGMGSPIRATHVPSLVELFGWVSPIRDLHEDMEKGLINAPAAVIEQARRENMTELSARALLQTAAGQEWLRGEYIRAQRLVENAAQELQALKGQVGERALQIFYRSLVQYTNRYDASRLV